MAKLIGPALRPGIDVGIESLGLDSLKAFFAIESAITGADMERTIDGASTMQITVHDPDRKLLKSGGLTRETDIEVDGLHFRLTAISKSDNSLTLTFEERAVALLRRSSKPLKVSRNKITRAQFVERLVREEKLFPIDFYTPYGKTLKPSKDAARKPGIPSNAKLKVKGARANATQIAVMNQVLAAAVKHKATRRATLVLVAAIITETTFYNNQGQGADAISFGVIQAIPGRSGKIGGGSFTKAEALDIDFSVKSVLRYSNTTFENSIGGGLNGVARRHSDWSIGRVAANVINGSVNNTQGAPIYVSRTNSHKAEAEAIIKAYGGGATLSAGGTGKFEFTRGTPQQKEDSWTAIRRMADEVNVRAFVSENTLFWADDSQLLAMQPVVEISEFDAGVQSIDFDIDPGRKAQECSVVVRSARWTAPPGTVVTINGLGAAAGRWLVHSFSRSLFDVDAHVTLRRPTDRLPEPKGEGASSSGVKKTSTVDVSGLAQVRAGESYSSGSGTFKIDAANAKNLLWWSKGNVAIASWMAPQLVWAKSRGWDGQITNGFRTFGHQTAIYNSGVRPAARPGSSNHEGAAYPRGAVDVGSYGQLKSVLAGYKGARRLVWYGAGDRVHFSARGN